MTVRLLLRLVAGLALAMFASASWATPSEAHAGHEKPAAATQQAQAEQTPTSEAMAVAAGQVAETASMDCGGHGKNESGKTSCCGNACHAAMSTEIATLQAVTVAVTILPTLPAPPELSGPTVHIKRPPRPSAALVG